MAKIDLGSKFKNVADTMKNTASKVDIQGMADSVKNTISKVDVQGMADSVKEVAHKAENAAKENTEKAVNNIKKIAEERQNEKQREEEIKAIETPVIAAISSINAVKTFYFLMAVDGTITNEEEEKFNLIGKELDPNFDSHKEQIINCCKEQIARVVDEGDYYDAVQDGVENALLVEQRLDGGFVTPKLLVWNLLSIAYSDDNYDELERKLLKYIVRKLNIAKDVFLEMENSLLTVSDIEKEMKWVKTTNRPYLSIEKQVKELEKRRQDIFESVKALILL